MSRPPGADTGLFGPASVAWQVHGDPAMALGGLRALLLQAVHPLAMAGVAQFSGYRSDPWGRLRRTAEFVAVTTFGTTGQARRAVARVRAAHEGLAGVESRTGTPYRVADPELLRWVHVCEAESFLSTYRRAGGRLRPGDADRYYGEMARLARLLGCPRVPRTERDVQGYLAGMRPHLRVTPEARRAAWFLLNPPMPLWVTVATPAKPGWWTLGGIGFALLPRWARRLYALPGLPSTDLAATLAARAARAALLLLPPGAREGPHLQQARARLAAGG